jgi:ribonucleotide reductase beta subunit family protein with ferritin-like domain
LFNSIKEIPCINIKALWAQKWIDSTDSFAKRLVAFAIVEGIFFSGSFCSIFWLKQYKGNIIPGLINSNEFIARDEGMHTDFACLLYTMIENKLDQDEIHEMFPKMCPRVVLGFILNMFWDLLGGDGKRWDSLSP